MRIAIIGGGNIGTLMAAELLLKNHEVYIFTSKPDIWDTKLSVFNSNDEFLFDSDDLKVSNDLEVVLKDSKFVFITYPPALFKDLAKKLLPYITKDMYIGIIPGYGGAEFQFKELVNNGATIFGLQRVHSIARLKEYGNSVYMLGRKDKLDIAIFPKRDEEYIKNQLENMFEMPCNILDNYLNITLTPSNPILHTSRLYSLFNLKMEYDENVLFYESWSDDSSDLLLKCDEELQNLCKTMVKFNLDNVISLKDHYESYSTKSMTNKIISIEAFKGITSPMIKNNGKWKPDFSSRYFSSDFSFGLKIILDIGKLYGINMPNIEKIWNWYVNVSGNDYFFDLSKFNINNKEEFEEFYLKK